jgi:uncharacterized protein YggE
MKLIVAILLTLVTACTFAQNVVPYPKTIKVTGTAEMEIIPDEIFVIVTLKEYEKRSVGKTDLEKIKTEFLAGCRSIGLPDSAVSIASYEGFSPNSWWRIKKRKDELYATIAYQVKFSSSKKIDEMVNKLDDDATQNFQVMGVSHSKIQEFRRQIKIQAIKAAKDKAVYLAEAIGEKPGEAITISEETEGSAIPYNLYNAQVMYKNYAADADKFDKSDAGIDFKKIKLKTQINAVFALK